MMARNKPTGLWPAARSASSDHLIANGQFAASVSHGDFSPFDGDENGTSLVVGLHLVCCPNAVMLAVSGLVVQALYRVLRGRTGSHISYKPGEIAQPFGANRYASTTVPWVVSGLRIVAPLLHVPPDNVFRCPATVPCGSMGRSARGHGGGSCASTAARTAVAQARAKYGPFCSAVTSAKPIRVAVLSVRKTNHGPEGVSPAAQILHGALSHVARLHRAVGQGWRLVASRSSAPFLYCSLTREAT